MSGNSQRPETEVNCGAQSLVVTENIALCSHRTQNPLWRKSRLLSYRHTGSARKSLRVLPSAQIPFLSVSADWDDALGKPLGAEGAAHAAADTRGDGDGHADRVAEVTWCDSRVCVCVCVSLSALASRIARHANFPALSPERRLCSGTSSSDVTAWDKEFVPRPERDGRLTPSSLGTTAPGFAWDHGKLPDSKASTSRGRPELW
ncbi:uncharacterized protein LOC128791474 [Vidua chalybeata]|uniref:uncharacterized protein LOC128791474 n=1 Tax=Vidua chalybeata TaxID=81927 RepID=UPI0023A8975D|nr:uncharacterized protein LOC128791474 [Vidua chalybeata]